MTDVRNLGDKELIRRHRFFGTDYDHYDIKIDISLLKLELTSRLTERQLLLKLAKAVNAHYTPLCPECGLRLKDWLDFKQQEGRE